MKALGALTLLLCLCASTAQASEPRPFDATYKAQALGFSATAFRRQTRIAPNYYMLQNSLTLTVLGANVGSVAETSEFRWEDGAIVPLHYEYEQTGLSASFEQIDFDWETELATSRNDDDSWQLSLSPGVLDKLSYSAQIGQDIVTKGLEEFRYQVLDEDVFDEHLYQITSTEVLVTPLGRLNTVKIERVRASDSRRRTTVWLASDWDYLLVRLEQVSSSGTETELSIAKATMGGEEVTGL
jgi:hypothetical protein